MSEEPTIRRIEARVYRYPVAQPVVTSFGVMKDRPAVFVRVEDSEGRVGWGETWCNFPSVGAEHRARLIEQVLAPIAVGRVCGSPREVFDLLSERTAVLALQSGEPGPFAQAIAGIDMALWDLAGQRADKPLWKLLGGDDATIGVYASGINPKGADATVRSMRDRGHRAFKLKIGFALEADLANLEMLREILGESALLAVDANQAWTLGEAQVRARQLRRFGLAWIEEPLRADRPIEEWQSLAASAGTPLAAGENLAGKDNFDQVIRSKAVRVVQPDLAKWGGISGVVPVGRAVRDAGLDFCPHYLGGGIGLLASAHVLAAVGGGGMLEVDSNENPLRDQLCGAVRSVSEGRIALGNEPGLGLVPDFSALERYRARH